MPGKMNCSKCTVNMNLEFGGWGIVNYCDIIAAMIRAMTHTSEVYNCPCNLFEVSWVPTLLFLCIPLLNFSLYFFLFKVCWNLLGGFFILLLEEKIPSCI